MGLFSCCSKNVIENVVIADEDCSREDEILHKKTENIQERKLTSATSKESKDSGCPSDPTDSIVSENETDRLHMGDGDTTGGPADRHEGQENEFITENSDHHEIDKIVNDTRPKTPDFCLTGIPVTHEPVRKIQAENILSEMKSTNTIAETVNAQGGVAYTLGESTSFKRLPPSRLPPIMPRKEKSRHTIDLNLKKAETNKQKQMNLIREKSIVREERRRVALERKKAIMDLKRHSTSSDDELLPNHRIHTDDELIAPALEL